MRRVLVAAVLGSLLACCAHAGEGGGAPELKPGLCAWDAAEKDPVVTRLKLTAAQKEKIAKLYADYLAERAKVKEKYREVRMAMLRRGMYRDFSELDTNYRPKLEALLTPAQKRKLAAGRSLVEKSEVEAGKIRTALLDEKDATRRAALEKQLEALEANLAKQLDSRVGKAE